MITLDEALLILDEKIGARRVETEKLPVRDAMGRFLAEDQNSLVNLPPFNKSAVDGYAVLEGDNGGEYSLEGTVPAGSPGLPTLQPGTTVKVMTGAPVPPGTDKVIKIEQAIEKDGIVRFENPSASSNILNKAEDVKVGDVVIEAGTRLGALEVSNLIGCGIAEVQVSRPIKIAVLATGDELVNSFDSLSTGKIMNTNGPLLCDLARKYALEVTLDEVVPDDMSILIAAIGRALAAADIVAISGGVSVGDFDFVPQAIEEYGLEIHFSRVAAKPGKPLTFATNDKNLLFGLPGNPVAVYLAFHTFILRAAAKLSGGTYEPKRFKVHLSGAYKRKSNSRMAFVPCRLTSGGQADPVPYHGSAHLAALMQADGFFEIPRGVHSLEAGAEVFVVMFTEGCG